MENEKLDQTQVNLETLFSIRKSHNHSNMADPTIQYIQHAGTEERISLSLQQ